MSTQPNPAHDMFLLVSERPEFAAGIADTLRRAGKVVLKARGIVDAVSLLERWRADSILVDGALAEHEMMPDLRAAAEHIAADLWVLDAAGGGL